jgi:RHS repeat-associated protein
MQRNPNRAPRRYAGRPRFSFAFLLTILSALAVTLAPGCGSGSGSAKSGPAERTGTVGQALDTAGPTGLAGFTNGVTFYWIEEGIGPLSYDCASTSEYESALCFVSAISPTYISGAGLVNVTLKPHDVYASWPGGYDCNDDLGSGLGPVAYTEVDTQVSDGSVWSETCLIPSQGTWTGGSVCASGYIGLGGSCESPFGTDLTQQIGKQLGPNPCSQCGASGNDSVGTVIDDVGQVAVAAPIDVGSGNVSYQHTDYTTAGQNPLAFTRYYNSLGGLPTGIATYATWLGVNWRSNYDGYLQLISSSKVVAERPGGRQLTFTLSGSTWTPDSDVDITLTNSGSNWTLTDHDDTVEAYTTVSGTSAAQLNSITARNGYVQTLTYTSGLLTSVSDSYSRTLTFTYNGNGELATVATPDSTTFTYSYDSSERLQKVASPVDASGYTYEYLYANSSFPYAVTGIQDRYGEQINGWTYDAYGRGLTSFQGGTGVNANLTTLVYNGSSGTTTVTNALGVTDTYTFAPLQNVPKVTGISRASTSTTAAATESFTFDSNGYMATKTDWNGNENTYTNNSHGQPTSITEAYGSSVARTTTIAYDSTFVHLPDSIATPGVTTSFTYDGSGDVLTKTLTDTTSTSTPYSTNGQTRVWTNTWSSYLLASTKTPNSNTTSYGYSSSGALTSITDALSHVTSITAYSGGGYPETIVDPNSVSTALTYDGQMRLASSAVTTGAGTRTTSYSYWFDTLVYQTTLPDGGNWNSYPDAAQRVTLFNDGDGNYITYTLDELGDRTQVNTYNSSETLYKQHSGAFDALGRLLVDTGGASQTTTYTYDKNGNALTVEDGLSHTTTRTFDALNRVSTSTDASSGVTTTTYDAHDRPLSVTDANGNATTYVYNGFGDIIQQASPDTGTTVYHYDSDGNLTSKTDAASVVTNQTFDALDRISTTAYPADSSENVAYAYDQTGTGYAFGIGRLTSLTDAAGSLVRDYDERGNIVKDKRTSGSTVLTTQYSYDPASRLASITYPSGAVVTYDRDYAGQVTEMPFSASGADASYVGWFAHLPFGQINSINYNNGDLARFSFDDDYRLTGLDYETYTSTPYLHWTYAYDAANNVSSITDDITSANSQSFSYDTLNRLTSASSSGTYGSLGYTYDHVGNLTASTAASTSYSYGLTSGTNRLSSITWTGNSESFSYTSTGNISTIVLNSSTTFSGTYNKANRLASVADVTPAISGEVYDWQGRRFSKTDSGSSASLYSYDLSGQLIEENNGGTVTDYIYVDGTPIANWAPSESHLYFTNTDRLGTPLVSRDLYGLTNWASYSAPYGTMTNTVSTGTWTGPVTENLRLPGQYADSETGFSQNGFRDYMPNLGRYLESDPIGLGGGVNTYAFAGGNPVRFTDRLGLQSDEEKEIEKVEGFSNIHHPSADLENDRPVTVPINPLSSAGQCRIDQGKQDKHIQDTNNYQSGKSVLTYPEPQKLLDNYAGTGQAVNDIPVGQPGSKERVDFGQTIGNMVYPNGASEPTSVGMIHYSSTGAHIVPARPTQ